MVLFFFFKLCTLSLSFFAAALLKKLSEESSAGIYGGRSYRYAVVRKVLPGWGGRSQTNALVLLRKVGKGRSRWQTPASAGLPRTDTSIGRNDIGHGRSFRNARNCGESGWSRRGSLQGWADLRVKISWGTWVHLWFNIWDLRVQNFLGKCWVYQTIFTLLQIFSSVISGLLMLIIGLCFAELAAAIPSPGAAYSYTHSYFGAFCAYFVGRCFITTKSIDATWLRHMNVWLNRITDRLEHFIGERFSLFCGGACVDELCKWIASGGRCHRAQISVPHQRSSWW